MPLCHAMPFHFIQCTCIANRQPSYINVPNYEFMRDFFQNLQLSLSFLVWMRRECSFYFNLNTWNLLYCIIRPCNLFHFISFRFILFIYFHIHRYHIRKGNENFNVRLIAWFVHFWVLLCWWIEIHIHAQVWQAKSTLQVELIISNSEMFASN